MLHTVNCTLTNKLCNPQIWWVGNKAGGTILCFTLLTVHLQTSYEPPDLVGREQGWRYHFVLHTVNCTLTNKL